MDDHGLTSGRIALLDSLWQSGKYLSLITHLYYTIVWLDFWFITVWAAQLGSQSLLDSSRTGLRYTFCQLRAIFSIMLDQILTSTFGLKSSYIDVTLVNKSEVDFYGLYRGLPRGRSRTSLTPPISTASPCFNLKLNVEAAGLTTRRRSHNLAYLRFISFSYFLSFFPPALHSH